MAKNDNLIFLVVAAGMILAVYLMIQNTVNNVKKGFEDTEKDLLSKLPQLPSVNLPSINLNLGGMFTGLLSGAGTTLTDAEKQLQSAADAAKKDIANAAKTASDGIANTVPKDPLTLLKDALASAGLGGLGDSLLSKLPTTAATPYSGPTTSTPSEYIANPSTVNSNINKAIQDAQNGTLKLATSGTAILPTNSAAPLNSSTATGQSVSMGGSGIWDPNINAYSPDNGVSAAPNLLPKTTVSNNVVSADSYIANNSLTASQVAAVVKASAPQTVVGSGSTMVSAPNPSAGQIQLIYHTETRMITRDNGKGVMVPQPTSVLVDQFGNTK